MGDSLLERLARMSQQDLEALARVPEELRAWAMREDERKAAAKDRERQRSVWTAKVLAMIGHNGDGPYSMRMINTYLGVSRPVLTRMLDRHGLSLAETGEGRRHAYWVTLDDLLVVLGLTYEDIAEDRAR